MCRHGGGARVRVARRERAVHPRHVAANSTRHPGIGHSCDGRDRVAGGAHAHRSARGPHFQGPGVVPGVEHGHVAAGRDPHALVAGERRGRLCHSSARFVVAHVGDLWSVQPGGRGARRFAACGHVRVRGARVRARCDAAAQPRSRLRRGTDFRKRAEGGVDVVHLAPGGGRRADPNHECSEKLVARAPARVQGVLQIRLRSHNWHVATGHLVCEGGVALFSRRALTTLFSVMHTHFFSWCQRRKAEHVPASAVVGRPTARANSYNVQRHRHGVGRVDRATCILLGAPLRVLRAVDVAPRERHHPPLVSRVAHLCATTLSLHPRVHFRVHHNARRDGTRRCRGGVDARTRCGAFGALPRHMKSVRSPRVRAKNPASFARGYSPCTSIFF